ncbi:hypothetical protein DSC45_29055 [Streptomyces sp. YIM 130001]|uniref:hypothetical protein n=1 Tax=Streptomyces sp. YIM 130001 TaxID=2259644 RepID=UPI000E6564AA|nr:hypothetical protein [Streptomyces sp. YIM 130001]RII11203.1 hypothetical protein DSC45_29055 [Streptomyces sp. YIM 130001]
MISTRRALAAVALAAGASALAMPAATASAASGPEGIELSANDTIDSLAAAGIPEEDRAELPTVSQQLGGLNRLNELHQLTDQAAPVTGLLPSIA